MKIELEHTSKLLDDYAIALGEYHTSKEKIGHTKDENHQSKMSIYLNNSREKREEIDNYLSKVNSTINKESNYFLLGELVDAISTLQSILKNDIDNLNHHKRDDPAVFLLDNFRQHLMRLVEKYGNKAST